MTETLQEPDWESFYRDYRKPGFLPGYEILNKLGGGAFGIVFKARKESIGKDYAVKFLKVDEPGVRGAVMRELEGVDLFAQVDHPNLVTIEDRGEVEGIPYILMGYAGDETLRDRLDKGPLEREEALRLFAQVARGVKALHDHSLVHFDLKPENVFLRGDVARIGDYGLSKLVSASHNSLSFGRGTPYYMAPELLQRKGDARSDVYSLGVLLYESLSGEVPFRGDSEWEILRKHESEAPEFPASIPPREREVIARCLHKDPADRYRNLDELLAHLFGSSAGQDPAPGGHQPRRDTNAAAGAPAAQAGESRHDATEAALAAARERLHRRRRRHNSPWAFVVLATVLGFPFVGTTMCLFGGKSRSPRRELARFSMPSELRPLALPSGTTPAEADIVRDALRRLRHHEISTDAARKLFAIYRPTAIVLGANELLALDYGSRKDTLYCIELHRVLGSITGYRFRCRTATRNGRITRHMARQNRATADRFRKFVEKLDH